MASAVPVSRMWTVPTPSRGRKVGSRVPVPGTAPDRAVTFRNLHIPDGGALPSVIDFNGPNAAFAKVECQLPPRYFTDYLTLLKIEGRWQVIAKAYTAVTK